jgi:hypothetical protein
MAMDGSGYSTVRIRSVKDVLSSSAWPQSARDVDLESLTARASLSTHRVVDRLRFAAELGREIEPLRVGSAGSMFATLAAIAAVDVQLARSVEPHLDALGILAQAGMPAGEGTWGVFAAEAPGLALCAEPRRAGKGEGNGYNAGEHGVSLSGTKPWCSLAAEVDHALVTANVEGGSRGLFAVDLGAPGITTHPEAWVARGMQEVPSGPVDFDAVPAQPVGEPGWYLRRPGFAWGGIGVAACWWGSAIGVARTLRDAAANAPDPWRLLAVGEVTVALADAEDALATAAAAIDSGTERTDAAWSAEAHLARSRVRRAVDTVLQTTTQTLGPAPSATNASYASRIADLELYVLQDHGRKDLARLGELVLAAAASDREPSAVPERAPAGVFAW